MFHLNNSQSLTVSKFVMGIIVGTSLHPYWQAGGGAIGVFALGPRLFGGGGPKML